MQQTNIAIKTGGGTFLRTRVNGRVEIMLRDPLESLSPNLENSDSRVWIMTEHSHLTLKNVNLFLVESESA